MDNDVVVSTDSWKKLLTEMKGVPPTADVDQTDAEIAALADVNGWRHLKSYLEARIEFIRDLFRGKIGTDSYELIGQKAIISDIIQDELRGLIAKVENTRKEVKSREVKANAKKR